jgi:hypothetical protein
MEPESSQPHSQVVVVTYCAETRVINQSAEKKTLMTFKSKILGKFFVPVLEDNQ